MCGFAGLVSFAGLDGQRTEAALQAALRPLLPRGPDAQDTWSDGQCGLANARLAVIDLSDAASLPMSGHGFTIAYNGEIYNFGELRNQLRAEGVAFATASDTEVLLAGWRVWGEELLGRLEGMFAFALWDGASRRLVLARDRFGKKPLLYHQAEGGIAFASDFAALEAVSGRRADIDHAALRQLFALRYVPDQACIAEGVAKLAPGHLLTLEANGAAVRQWAAPPNRMPYERADDAEADLVTLFDAAVRRRMVADVPVGVFLSGGIDSALTAAAMVRAANSVRSFTVGFEGAADYYEERPAAAVIARHLGTDHTEITVTSEDALRALDGVFDGLDEPFADSSALPTFLLARETRRHVTVALSGDGADEVFGGYRKYQGEIRAAQYQRIPSLLRRGVIEPLASALPERKSHPLLERARRLRRFARHAGKDAVGRQAGWARLMDEAELDALFEHPQAAETPEHLIAGLRAGEADPLNAMLRADMGLGLVGDMLVKVDRMSMANSLEVRCPFLDQAVVDCAAAIPGAWKIGPRQGKKILRSAFADRLPSEIFAAPKKGFEIPIAEWLTGPLDDLTRRAIDAQRLKRQGLFRPELPAAWYAALKSHRRDTSEKLWTLVCFQAWCERFRPDLAGDAA